MGLKLENLPGAAAEILSTRGRAADSWDEQTRRLAEALAAIHGDAVVTREKGGVHIYLASPEALQRDGRKEIHSRHLAVNADKHFGRGKWAGVPEPQRRRCACCMKYGTVYTVDQLMLMRPLAERGIPGTTHRVVERNQQRWLVDDGRGNMVPPPPGATVPLSELDGDHPAIVFCRERGWDPAGLEEQFSACFCTDPLPENREAGIYHGRLPGGFDHSPGGRIVFLGMIDGVRRVWQARMLELVRPEGRWVWSYKALEWVRVSLFGTDGAERLVPPFDGTRPDGSKLWKPRKYVTAWSAERNTSLLGYDAAAASQSAREPSERFAAVSEGPSDAASLGAPCVAAMGKFVSEDQARLVARFAKVVYGLANNDAGGADFDRSARRAFAATPCMYVSAPPPPEFNDYGEMKDAEASWAHILSRRP